MSYFETRGLKYLMLLGSNASCADMMATKIPYSHVWKIHFFPIFYYTKNGVCLIFEDVVHSSKNEQKTFLPTKNESMPFFSWNWPKEAASSFRISIKLKFESYLVPFSGKFWEGLFEYQRRDLLQWRLYNSRDPWNLPKEAAISFFRLISWLLQGGPNANVL